MTPSEILLAVAAIITAYVALRKANNEGDSRATKEWHSLVLELKEHANRLESSLDSLEKDFARRLDERDEIIESLKNELARLREEIEELQKARQTDQEQIDELEYLMSVGIDHMELLSDEIRKLQGTPPKMPEEILDWLKKYRSG